MGIEALRRAVTTDGCDEHGVIGLASYPWLSSSDITSPVIATSVVVDFESKSNWQQSMFMSSGEEERYICSTGPVVEFEIEIDIDPVVASPVIDKEPNQTNEPTKQTSQPGKQTPAIATTTTTVVAKPNINIEQSFLEDTGEGNGTEVTVKEPEKETAEAMVEEETTAPTVDEETPVITVEDTTETTDEEETMPDMMSSSTNMSNSISLCVSLISFWVGIMFL